ncbi:MAG: GAF domain-containing protein [Rubrivivax sp.]|nr:GAF domain-containing protein [Rubrivivax sp.]
MSAQFRPAEEAIRSADPDHHAAALQALAALDTPSASGFDALAHVAAHACAASIAIVSLIDGERVWFQSVHGIDAGAPGPHRSLLCGETARSRVVIEVTDAQRDPRFADGPLLGSALRMRYGAGAPIRYQDQAVGTICVFDPVPHRGSAASLRALESLAMIATALLRARIEAFLFFSTTR